MNISKTSHTPINRRHNHPPFGPRPQLIRPDHVNAVMLLALTIIGCLGFSLTKVKNTENAPTNFFQVFERSQDVGKNIFQGIFFFALIRAFVILFTPQKNQEERVHFD